MNYFNKSFLYPHNLGFHYATFEEYLFKLNVTRKDLEHLSGVSTRTMRRYINENNAPQWVYLVAFCAAGYLLSEAWQGWRFHNDGIVHRSSVSCNHDSIKPSMLMDMGQYYQRAHSLERSINDLTRENTQLRAKIAIVDYKRLVPANVKPISRSVSYEQISKQITGGKRA